MLYINYLPTYRNIGALWGPGGGYVGVGVGKGRGEGGKKGLVGVRGVG